MLFQHPSMATSKNIIFHPDFQHRKNLLHLIQNFETKGEILKDKRNVLKRIDIESTSYIIKAFKSPAAINKVVYKYFRPSKAKRSYSFALKLLENDIKTPFPVAYIEYFDAVGLNRSYYISEELDYDLTYRELIHEPNYPEREKILREFTAFTYKLHENNIFFKDHSPGNTLIVKRDGNYDFYLVDLNRMDFTELDFDSRMKNFVRLYPTPDMIEIMSEEYAKLYGREYETVHHAMQEKFEKFRKGYERKKNITRPLKKLFK